MPKSDEIDSLLSLAWEEEARGRPVTAAEVAKPRTRSAQSYAVYFSRMLMRGLVDYDWDKKKDRARWSVTDYGHTLLGASGPRAGSR